MSLSTLRREQLASRLYDIAGQVYEYPDANHELNTIAQHLEHDAIDAYLAEWFGPDRVDVDAEGSFVLTQGDYALG